MSLELRARLAAAHIFALSMNRRLSIRAAGRATHGARVSRRPLHGRLPASASELHSKVAQRRLMACPDLCCEQREQKSVKVLPTRRSERQGGRATSVGLPACGLHSNHQ